MKKNNGITLVALVISIIIVIILAGVTINTLINNGIIDKAKTATQEYKNAQDYEETQIAKYANYIDNNVDGSRDTVTISKEEYNEIVSRIEAIESKNNEVVVDVTLSNSYGSTALPNGYTETNCYIDNIMAYHVSNGIYYETSAGQSLEAGLKGGSIHVWGKFSKAKIILKKYEATE